MISAGRRLSRAGDTVKMAAHAKCRGKYPGDVERFAVPDDKVSWSVEWPEYKPVDYTAPVVEKGPVWADVDFR